VRATLRALPFLLLATGASSYASGQHLTCYAIGAGDTAAGLAKRFTGSARNRRQPWFQIVNPATAALVPKSRYDVIQAGWHVCVDSGYVQPVVLPVPLQTTIPQRQAAIDIGVLRWAAFLFLSAAGLVLVWVAREYVGERRVRVDIMRGFGHVFISEFERPLIRNSADEAPVRSRLRVAPVRRRLEVLLAPAEGRTYPNLFDHRKNVEYDVERVLWILRDEPFINGPPYARGRWVVIPFRLETDRP